MVQYGRRIISNTLMKKMKKVIFNYLYSYFLLMIIYTDWTIGRRFYISALGSLHQENFATIFDGKC